jgi:hypothetical protein
MRTRGSREAHAPDSPGVRLGRAAPSSEGAARSRRQGSINQRLRDRLMRTNIDVIAVGLFLAWFRSRVVRAESDAGGPGRVLEASDEVQLDDGTGDHGVETFPDEEKASYAFLFPWVAEIVGVFVYYFLSRYAHDIPYTAIMFIVGAMIGIYSDFEDYDPLSFSASTWAGIDGEAILLTFLPVLIFHDSYSIDVHLFNNTFWQVIVFAFPMMLAGTCLTALFARVVFPYGWSWNLCMTFGSILGATDPVAVSVLMNELGAPPRLKVRSLLKFIQR